MSSDAWFRRLFSLGRSRRSASNRRFTTDSLVPQLTIKRLEERLVLNGDAAPVEVLVVNAGDAAADGQADVYHVEQVENEIRVSVNGQQVQSISADRVSAIQINGSADNDVLVADLLAGVNVTFDGGGGYDSVSLQGGDYDLVSYQVGDSTTDIAAQSSTTSAHIELTGVEQVTDSLAARNREFSIAGSGRELTLSESPGGNGSSRLVASGASAFTVDFRNPNGSLTIDSSANGPASDALTVEGLGNGFDGDVRIVGGTNDTFELNGDIDLGHGNLEISTGSVVLNQSITSAASEIKFHATKSVTINSESAVFNGGGSVTITAPEITVGGIVAAAGGFVSLDSGDHGVTKVEGVIDVAQLAQGRSGGEIQILGENVQLLGTARINASGDSGGGTVLVGGGYQGNDPSVRNGQYTYVGSDVMVNVDAVFAGFGGTAIFWADRVTAFYGTVTARGGTTSGDGGFVEISGKDGIAFNGWADAAAPAGRAGTVLFDPTDIVIHDAADGPQGNDGGLPNLGVGAGLFEIGEAALEALAAASNIVLTATNNITLNDLADGVLSLLTAAGSLTITADSDNAGGGTFTMLDTSDTIQTAGGDITISGAGLTIGNIVTSGGSVDLTSSAAISFASIDTSGANNITGGNVDVDAANLLTAGTVDTSGGADNPNPGAGLAAGTISLEGGDVVVTGTITARGSDNQGGANNGGAGGSVTLRATDGDPTITLGADIDTRGGAGSTAGNGGSVLFQGDVSLSASVQVLAGVGTATIAVGDSLAAGANNLTLSANEINFGGGANSVSGTGTLTLAPGADTVSIDIGSPGGAANILDLSDTDLAALADGFASITIGSATGAHDIDVGTASFKDSVTIRTPDGGSIDIQGQLDTLAGGGSVTLDAGTSDITLSDDIITAGFAIDIQGDVEISLNQSILLDSTNGGAAAAGANINITGPVDAPAVSILGESLSINAGTAGAVTLDAVGVSRTLDLTIINSGSTTISGAVDIIEFEIQDTTTTVSLQGNAEIGKLTTAVQPYSVSLTGTDNTISSDTNFLNTGTVTFGNNANDMVLFESGVDTTTGPAQLNLFGRLRTAGDQIDLGPVVLQGASNIDATNNGANASGADINVGTITGNNQSLTISAGSSGTVTLTTVGAAGASLASFTVNARDAILANNVIADSQDYNADVNTSSLLDTTDGGGNAAGGTIDISGALTGIAPQLNGGANGAVNIGSVNVTTLTIINSGSTTISGAAAITTFDVQDTSGTVTIQGNATITTLTTAVQSYGVALLGSNSTITNDTSFLNTGAVTLGNNANDVILFNGGVDTTTGPSQTNLFGRLRTSGDQIDLGAVNLQGDSVIDPTNNGGAGAGANINLGSVTGNGNDLVLNAGTTGVITVTGSSLNLGDLTISQTVAATFLGSLTAASLITTAQPYDLTLSGTTNSVTNDVNFLNTGTLTLGNAATDTFLFNGGVDTTGGPTAFDLFGQLRTSGDQIDLAAVTLQGNSEIDTTNNAGTPAGSNINVGAITGDNLTLDMNAGTNGDVNLASVGLPGTSLASFVLSADTATLTANVVADAQNYTADLILAEGTSILLDTTDGGLLLFSGPINVTGSVNGTAGGLTETLRLDAGIFGVITLDDLGDSTLLNATVFNSLSTTIAGSASLAILNVVDTTTDFSILGSATIDTLVTAVQPYNVSLFGSINDITNDVNFLNTGSVTLGNNAADLFLFSGGISTITGPSQTNLFGQVRTSGDQIDLGIVILQGNSQLDTTNGGGNAAGANLNTSTITGAGNSLTLNAGTAGDIAVGQIGAAANEIGNFVIDSARNLTASGTIDAASLIQSAGTGTTNLLGAATVTNDVSITTTGNVLVNGMTSNVGSISLAGELIVINANMSATGAGQEIVLSANSNAANAIQIGLATTLTTAAGRISGQALLPTVLNMSVNTGLPLAPPDMIVGMLQVFINDTLGTNFTVEIDWRISERPGIPVPPAVPVSPPPQNLNANVVSSAVNGVTFTQFEHQYNDSPEPNPGDDINVSIAITQFAGDTIRLSTAGANILADGAVTTNIVVPVDVPLFGFVLVPSPGALPVTPPPAPPVNPFNPPVVQIVQVTNTPFEPNSAGVTGRAEVRYYELRIVSFDENGKLVESIEERINLSDPRLEAITPFNPSKLPELFKRLPGDRYRIYLMEDGAERLMIEFVIEQVGDEGRPVELPERIETDGQGARLENDRAPALGLQDRSASVPVISREQTAQGTFIEELGRISFVSSGGLVFGAAMLSENARQRREFLADQRMAKFRKRLRSRVARGGNLK